MSWGAWQSATLVLAGLLALLFALSKKSAGSHAATSCIALTAMLWLVSDAISVRQLTAATYQLLEGETGSGRQMNTGTGAALTEIVEAIPSKRRAETGVISIALDQSGEFQAQKLPLLLAPRSAATTKLAEAKRLANSWKGHFVVFSNESTTIEAAVDQLEASSQTRLIWRGADYAILAPALP
jgi:hypothetical protein